MTGAIPPGIHAACAGGEVGWIRDAASIATLVLTTAAIVVEKDEEGETPEAEK